MKAYPSTSAGSRRHLTPKAKAQILRSYERSGLSLLSFARKHELCYASLLRWRARQGKGAKVLLTPDTPADPRFVPVKIESEVLSDEYVLSWAGGRSLKIPLQFETDSLRRLLAVLEGVR